MTIPLAQCFLFFFVLVLPGILLMRVLEPGAAWPRAIAVGSVGSLTASIVCGDYLLIVQAPFVLFVVLEYTVLAVVIWRRPSAESSPIDGSGNPGWLMALVTLVVASRSVPLFFNELPQGIDPAFHCLLARKILESHAAPTDWAPYESVRLHYPVGLHILLAEASRWTGLPIHVVFKSWFPLTAGLSTLAVYVVASRLTRDPNVGWFASATYGFLPVWGSLDYYRWGGLPNALGMLFLLVIVDASFTEQPRRAAALVTLVLASLILTHHHSTLSTLVVIGGYSSFVALCYRPLAGKTWAMVIALPLALLLCSFPLGRMLAGPLELGHTSVFRFDEPPISLASAVMDIGPPLAVLGMLGVVTLFRREKIEESLFLTFWIVSLLVVFVTLEYAYRLLVYEVRGQLFTALTPSRFLTNLAYPLSIAAAYPLTEATSGLRPPLAKAVVLVLALGWSVVPLRAQCMDDGRDADLEAFAWLEAHSDPRALVISSSPWAPYVTGREAAYTPLPASEARNATGVVAKRALESADLVTLSAFGRRSGRPIYVVRPNVEDLGSGSRLVARTRTSSIYEIRE